MKEFGVVGVGITYSKSDLINNSLFKLLNKNDYHFSLLPIQNDELEKYINLLKDGTYKGYNITTPFKIEVLPYLDYQSEEVKKIGACNTVIYEDGLLKGFNTDYYGFKESLKYYNVEPENKDIYIVGNSGAALTVYTVFKELGANVYIIARNKEKAKQLFPDVISMDDYKSIKEGYVLVNCTNQGPHGEQLFDDEFYKRFEFGYDLLYVNTPHYLLSNKKIDGKYMLISQALKTYEIWTGTTLNNKEELFKELAKLIF